MNLKETIYNDLKEAMKAKDELKLSTLRMLKADIMKYEVSGADKESTDEIVQGIVKKAVKQRKDAAEGFEKGGNKEFALKEMAEAQILEQYLPEQMSEAQVEEIAKEAIEQLNATSADFGKVMGVVMGKTKGQADGNIVSGAVKKLLS